MSIEQVVAAIDEDIQKLQRAKQLLLGTPDVLSTLKRRGRRPGTKNKTRSGTPAKRRGRPAGSKNATKTVAKKSSKKSTPAKAADTSAA